ncbi:MAG: aldo/keto reductase [Clostridia bacterium]|nr:aldo/keto reductase [Clostridia bacterium]
MENVKLNNGVEMPMVGYGAYGVAAKDTKQCVLDALEVGYRMIDTAQHYGNEAEVGEAVKESGVARGDLFLGSKIWFTMYERVEDAVKKSLDNFQTDYLDLMLIEHPIGNYYKAWEALQKLYEDKKVRAIGVSGFKADRVMDLGDHTGTKPMVDQLETHPFLQQVNAKAWMDKCSCQLMAWGPFGQGHEGLFDYDILKKVADKYGKSLNQIILRWNIQRGIVVVPKTVQKSRMEANIDVFDFDLEKGDLIHISEMDEGRSLFLDGDEPDTYQWLLAQPPVVQ